jgi:mannitol/fructose-specific phosphotransferase system IIA component (Ntr-type)
MMIPTATSTFYLKLLSDLSRIFRQKEVSSAFLAAKTEEELWKILIKTTRKMIK